MTGKDKDDLIADAWLCIEHGDFAAPKDRAIVWSGDGNREAAELFAQFDIGAKSDRSRAWCRLEDTPAGRELRKLIPFERREELGVSEADYEKIWRAASERFSLSQEGDVKTFVQGALEDRTFRRQEQDNLLWDERVTSLNGCDKTKILNGITVAEASQTKAGGTAAEVRRAGQDAGFKAICDSERSHRARQKSWERACEVLHAKGSGHTKSKDLDRDNPR